MFLPNESHIDRTTRGGPAILLAGLAIVVGSIVLTKVLWKPNGLPLTGFAVFSYGVYASMMRGWRTEPGLWMLGGSVALMIGACWGIFEIEALKAMISPRPPLPGAAKKPVWEQVRFAADCSLGLLVFGKAAIFLVAAAKANWTITRPTSVLERRWALIAPQLLAVVPQPTGAEVRVFMRGVLDAVEEPPRARHWGRLSDAKREQLLLKTFPDERDYSHPSEIEPAW
jgi:hypothetical protein